MRNNTKKKIAPVLVTLIVLVYVGPIVGMLLAAAGLSEEFGGGAAFFVLYAAIGGAVMAGILLALSQRLKEIDGGEEEDAKKY